MDPLISSATQAWRKSLDDLPRSMESYQPVVEGVLTRMVGLTLEARGCQAPIGAQCHVVNPDGSRGEGTIEAQSIRSARLRLRNQGIQPRNIRKQRTALFSSLPWASISGFRCSGVSFTTSHFTMPCP